MAGQGAPGEEPASPAGGAAEPDEDDLAEDWPELVLDEPAEREAGARPAGPAAQPPDPDEDEAADWPELVPEAAPPAPARRDPGQVLADLVPWRIRAAAREGALRLEDLPGWTGILVEAALVATMLALAFIGLDLLLGWWPGTVIRIPGSLIAETLPGRLSIPAFVLAVMVLGTGAAAVAGSAANRPGRSRRIVQVLVGLAGLEIGAALYGTGGIAEVIVSGPLASVPRVAGAAGMAAGVLLAVSPGPLSRAVPWAAGLAAVPFLAAALTTLQLARERVILPLLTADDSWPQTIEGAALAAGALSPVLALAGGLLGVLVLWQSVVAARAIRRRVATASAGLAAARPRVLGALLGAKAAWLVAGYAGLLPGLLGGGDGADGGWARARADDPAGIVVAVGLGWLAAIWLLRGARPAVPDAGVPVAAAIFAVGFNGPFLLAGLLLGLLPVAALAGAASISPPDGLDLQSCLAVIGTSPGAVVECLSVAARDLIPYAGLATWGGSLALVVLLAIAGGTRGRAVAVALGAIVLWAAPSAIFVARGILGVVDAAIVGRPELLNVDTALTVAVALLAVLWWSGRQRVAGPRSLTLILVISTLLAQASVVVPEGGRTLVFGLLVVLPPLYGLVFESERVNEAGEGRRELVLRTLGLQLLGLGFLLTALAFDQLQTRAADLADLLVPPVVAVLVAAEVARRARPRSLPAHPRRDLVPALGWVAAGAAAVIVIAVVLRPVTVLPPGPTEAERYGSFVARVDQERGLGARALDNLLTIVSTDPNGIQGAFDQFSLIADEAKRWVDANPPAPCYAAEQRAWEGVVAALVKARDSFLSGQDLEANIAAYVQGANGFSPGLATCRTDGRTGP